MPDSSFARAHADAQKAVTTFLPSLGPNPPQPQGPAPQPHPLAQRDIVHEMTHAAALARHVEQASARIVQGLPANPAPPPPEQTFGNVLDVVHSTALRNEIARRPEEDRSRLISEAQDSTTKWIMSHNGKVIVHGKVMIAHGMPEAERLAAKIVNDTVEEHDQQKQEEAEAALGDGDEGGRQGSVRSAARGSGQRKAVSRASERDSGGLRDSRHSQDPGDGAAAAVPAVGALDPASNRVITHTSSDLDQAQETATAAAPELEETLDQVADSTPGVSVHGVRPTKDKDRAQRKAEADDKPVNTHSDLLAGRLTVDSPQARDAAVAKIKSTAPVIDEEDSFERGDPDYGFRSHDLQVALGDGSTSAEVQIVPQEVADIDEETHPTYEKRPRCRSRRRYGNRRAGQSPKSGSAR
jgi:hypothetical protein